MAARDTAATPMAAAFTVVAVSAWMTARSSITGSWAAPESAAWGRAPKATTPLMADLVAREDPLASRAETAVLAAMVAMAATEAMALAAAATAETAWVAVCMSTAA